VQTPRWASKHASERSTERAEASSATTRESPSALRIQRFSIINFFVSAKGAKVAKKVVSAVGVKIFLQNRWRANNFFLSLHPHFYFIN
jgi:hypothetical protein